MMGINPTQPGESPRHPRLSRLAGGRYFRITAPEPLRGPVWFKHKLVFFKLVLYPLVNVYIAMAAMEHPPFFMGKSTISTGSFSIAMLNYQRVRSTFNLRLFKVFHSKEDKAWSSREELPLPAALRNHDPRSHLIFVKVGTDILLLKYMQKKHRNINVPRHCPSLMC